MHISAVWCPKLSLACCPKREQVHQEHEGRLWKDLKTSRTLRMSSGRRLRNLPEIRASSKDHWEYFRAGRRALRRPSSALQVIFCKSLINHHAYYIVSASKSQWVSDMIWIKRHERCKRKVGDWQLALISSLSNCASKTALEPQADLRFPNDKSRARVFGFIFHLIFCNISVEENDFGDNAYTRASPLCSNFYF